MITTMTATQYGNYNIYLMYRHQSDTTLGDSLSVTRDTGQWFSPSTPASSTNKTGHHDVAKIMLKVVLNTLAVEP
jgi:hypothetical protein